MIFGASGSMFETTTGTKVYLSSSILYPNYDLEEETVNKSIFTGKSYYNYLGSYMEFKVTVHLYKFDSPITTFNDLYQYNHQNVYFYPHWDGDAIEINGSTDKALFHITKMEL